MRGDGGEPTLLRSDTGRVTAHLDSASEMCGRPPTSQPKPSQMGESNRHLMGLPADPEGLRCQLRNGAATQLAHMHVQVKFLNAHAKHSY